MPGGSLGVVALHPPGGGITVCCGHAVFSGVKEYTLGYIQRDSLKELVSKAQRNLLYWWLYSRGPAGIIKNLSGREVKAYHICHACYILLTRYRPLLYQTLPREKEVIFLKEVLLSEESVMA